MTHRASSRVAETNKTRSYYQSRSAPAETTEVDSEHQGQIYYTFIHEKLPLVSVLGAKTVL